MTATRLSRVQSTPHSGSTFVVMMADGEDTEAVRVWAHERYGSRAPDKIFTFSTPAKRTGRRFVVSRLNADQMAAFWFISKLADGRNATRRTGPPRKRTLRREALTTEGVVLDDIPHRRRRPSRDRRRS